MATARSPLSHSTPVIRCRAVSSITTESARSRERTGAHNLAGARRDTERNGHLKALPVGR